jgi:shikimate kinase
VAAAAGAILEPDDREILREPFVAWLGAPAEVLAARAVGAEHRPWLDDDPVGWFRRTSAARDSLYAAVADVTVDTSATGPEVAADAILAAASSRG